MRTSERPDLAAQVEAEMRADCARIGVPPETTAKIVEAVNLFDDLGIRVAALGILLTAWRADHA